MSDVVLDLETLGLAPGAAVLAIGAVSLRGPEFYAVIRNPSGAVSTDTVKWWLVQREEVRVAVQGGSDEREVLNAFAWWLNNERSFDGSLRLWGSEDFDTLQLGAAYARHGLPAPWHYQEPRGLRTAFDLLGVSDNEHPWGDLIEHVALDCARHAASLLKAHLVPVEVAS